MHKKLRRIWGIFSFNKGLTTWGKKGGKKQKSKIQLWINIWIGQAMTSSSAKSQTQDALCDNERCRHIWIIYSRMRGDAFLWHYALIIKFHNNKGMSAGGTEHQLGVATEAGQDFAPWVKRSGEDLFTQEIHEWQHRGAWWCFPNTRGRFLLEIGQRKRVLRRGLAGGPWLQ